MLTDVDALAANLRGDVRVVVDDERHVKIPQHGLHLPCEPFDLAFRGLFGPKLDQIDTTLAKGGRHRLDLRGLDVAEIENAVEAGVSGGFLHGGALTQDWKPLQAALSAHSFPNCPLFDDLE